MYHYVTFVPSTKGLQMYDEYDDYDLTLSDLYSSEELEDIRRESEEIEYNSRTSLESLGLINRDFF